MRNTHFSICNIAKNTEKLGKWGMHSGGLEAWRKT
jgi:hypothetical protein